jgi:hypothetical protein
MRAGIWLCLLGLAGCGAGAPLSEDDVASLHILPDRIELCRLLEAQLVFEAHTVGGAVSDVAQSPALDILATDGEVIRLSGPGRIQGVMGGRTRLVAYFAGRQATADVVVADGVLAGLVAEPERIELEIGRQQAVGLKGSVSDGSRIDVSSGALGTRYRIDNPGVAAITADGWLFALGEGTALLRATLGEYRIDIPVEVRGPGPHLVRLELSPPSISLRQGEEVPLSVSGLYDDGGRRDLTADPATTYLSSDRAVVEVNATGRVTARLKGEAVITVGHGLQVARASVSVSE